MPWNDQSGGDKGPDRGQGPWGSGPRQPWGQPPRGPRRRGDQPDLDEMLRRFRERLGGGFGGGGGDGAASDGPRVPVYAIVAGLLAAGWLASGFYIVDAGERGVVTRFGRLHEIRMPGLNYHMPAPIEARTVVNVDRQTRLQIAVGEQASADGEGLMITGDRNIVDIGFTVLYRLSNASDYVFKVREPDDAIRALAESAMREVVGQRELQAIITTDRGAVEQSVEQLMQRVLNDYEMGVQILNIQLQKAVAPPQVIDAFDDVVRAGSDRQTEINRAEQYRNEVVPRARGEAAQQMQQAEGYSEQVVREANGEAARFNSVYEEYRRNPRVTRERLYLETMERVYRGADKIIIDRGSGVQPYLPLQELRRNQTTTQPQAPAPQAAPPRPGNQ